MTKTEYLQNLADSLKSDRDYEFVIEFRPFMGWFAVPDEQRWIGDRGEYLGLDWKQAEYTIRSLFL
jgi:hypothetical protein